MISAFTRLLDLISPRQCASCGGRLTTTEQVICANCLLHLPRTNHAAQPYDNELAQRFWKLLPIEKAAAYFYFHSETDTSRMIYRFKYGTQPTIARHLGMLAAKEMQASGFFEGIDIMVPVPLTRKRRLERGYNQSVEIAKGISEVTNLPISKSVICRKSFKESQTLLRGFQRLENVKNAFELTNAKSIEGKHVLIVDDVATTGATICACGEELAKADNIRISVMTLGFTKD